VWLTERRGAAVLQGADRVDQMVPDLAKSLMQVQAGGAAQQQGACAVSKLPPRPPPLSPPPPCQFSVVSPCPSPPPPPFPRGLPSCAHPRLCCRACLSARASP
jgi:hypothetical protein